MRTLGMILAFVTIVTCSATPVYSVDLPQSDSSKTPIDAKKNLTAKDDVLEKLINKGVSKEESSKGSSSVNPGSLQVQVHMPEIQVRIPEKKNSVFGLNVGSQVLTAFTAAVAVVLGPLITLFVTKWQTDTALSAVKQQSDTAIKVAEFQARTNVLSKFRQDWINKLRDEISHFNVESQRARKVAELLKDDPNKNEKLLELYFKVVFHQVNVRLLINPDEANHANLVSKMEEMRKNLPDDGYDCTQAESELSTLSQKISRCEWNKIKEDNKT